jgi:hypothetical protein
MRDKRPQHEHDFVTAAIAPVVAKLRESQAAQEEFLLFASKHGAANLMRFPARLYHILRDPAGVDTDKSSTRLPDAYVATLLLLYSNEMGILPRAVDLKASLPTAGPT